MGQPRYNHRSMEGGGTMSWSKAVLAGAAGGVVLTLADWVMHGFIMAQAYTKYEVFSQEPANPLHFFVVGICIGIMAAILFGKTRDSWGRGAVGGATYGFFLGLVGFFQPFYHSLVFDGFPYYMSWCWGGIHVIGFVILGTVLGLMMRRS
jgi:hypothetical protein